ncbi:MAG: hypothetical protein M3Y28_07260, partial [Armatimonadota bacterium]|nr:hypothetical protein [Armatimonadota bacterium]
MRERLFIGRQKPILPQTVAILQQRYAQDDAWDMSGVLVVLPGRQATRRLIRLLETAAAREGFTGVQLPETITPSELPERLYAPKLPLATPTQAHFAWMRAARSLPPGALHVLAPRAASSEGAMVWAGIAEEAARLRAEAAAERLTLADVARACGDDPRWQALARLERAYSVVLAEANLADRDDARKGVLDAGTVSCDKDVILVATMDLNGVERALLRLLPSSVCALVPAPPDEHAAFDDVGCLEVGFWHDKPIPIDDPRLHFVPGPADQVSLLGDLIADLDGVFARDEITVGVGDEAGAETLALSLAASGLPVFSPFGRSLGRVGPSALLGAVGAYLREPSARAFAVLLRHPDWEQWLNVGEDAEPLLNALDDFRADHLPESLPIMSARGPLAPNNGGTGEKVSDDGLILSGSPIIGGGGGLPPTLSNALARTDALLEPLRTTDRTLSEWADAIAQLLRQVYGARVLANETAQTRRAFEGLATILTGIQALPPILAPSVSGPEALAHVLGRADGVRLPSDEVGDAGLEMMGWLELALDDAPVLLLTGFNEGCVPAGGGDDSLLPDSLRRKLGLADNRRRQARDGLLLRVMVESRPHVHLIVPRRGVDGTPRMPSRLLFACDGATAARRARRYADGDAAAPPRRPLFPP